MIVQFFVADVACCCCWGSPVVCGVCLNGIQSKYSPTEAKNRTANRIGDDEKYNNNKKKIENEEYMSHYNNLYAANMYIYLQMHIYYIALWCGK